MQEEQHALLGYLEKITDCPPFYRRTILDCIRRNAIYLCDEDRKRLERLLGTEKRKNAQ